ncbi:hypothetical protein [Pedobacter jamesrossensis]|uniref:Uncharacterized protein n=1 Tax=Pedobacter jamesrossensis TaxID=1908238 RepID=A0ABV8NLT4_9SPHI
MKYYIWHFSKYRFFKAFVAVGILTTICFFAFVSEDRNVFAPNFFLRSLSDIYSVLQFPTHTLFWEFFSYNNGLYFAGLVINSLLFAFIIEIGIVSETVYKLKKEEGKEEKKA